LPENESQVQAVLKACHALAVPVVARGAGTGLSGGAMPHKLGVTLSMAKFNLYLRASWSIHQNQHCAVWLRTRGQDCPGQQTV